MNLVAGVSLALQGAPVRQAGAGGAVGGLVDQVGVAVLSRLEARLSDIDEPRTLRPLNTLASPAVSLNSQLRIVRTGDHFIN